MVKAYWYINFFRQVWQNDPAYAGWQSAAGDTFRIVLLGNSYTPNQDIDAVAAHLSGEVSGQGYDTGGQVLVNKTISVASGALVLSADDVTWASCVFNFRWAAIYDDSNTLATQKQLVRFIYFENEIALNGDTLRLKFDGQGVIVDITPPSDTTPPQLDKAEVDGNKLFLRYDENLKTSATPATTAFQPLVNSVPTTVTSVAMTANEVVLTLALTVLASDTVTLSYVVPIINPIQDLAGNHADAFAGQVVNNITVDPPPPGDVTPPVLQTAVINAAIITLTYDEALNVASVPATSAFTVFYSGIAKTIQSVTVQGQNVTIAMTVEAVAQNVVTANYTAGANPVEDTSGNNAANFSGILVTNQTPGDTTPPVLTNLTSNGLTLVLTYNEPLITSAAPTTVAFTIRVNGSTRSINIVTMAQFTVTLQLSSPVTDTDSVTASYTAPPSNPIRDLATNPAPNFANLPVTNTTPPAAPTDAATFVSQSVPALSMQALTTQSVSVVMKNTGTAVWSSGGGYHLYSQNPAGNNNWGITQVPVVGNVLGTANASFQFTITAPSAPGTYNFQWRMRHSSTEFGAQSANISITVTAPPPVTGEIFVATTGSDTGGNGSSGSPYRTIEIGRASCRERVGISRRTGCEKGRDR